MDVPRLKVPSMRGEKNPRWNGGVSEYKDHYLLKLNRLEALKKSKGKCYVCDEKATIVHHLDFSKTNHSIENLLPLCQACHVALHNEKDFLSLGGVGRPSKVMLATGRTKSELARMFGVTKVTIYNWLRSEAKTKWLVSEVEKLQKRDESSENEQTP